MNLARLPVPPLRPECAKTVAFKTQVTYVKILLLSSLEFLDVEVPKRLMEVIVGIDKLARKLNKPAITIGNFDGVHWGHRVLFDKVKDWANRLQGQSVVMTFHPHPIEVLAPGNGPRFITRHQRKLELIAASGIDAAIVVPFSREFAAISARDFVQSILVERVGVKAVIVGHDYRFGRNREGDIEFLRRLGDELGFTVEMVSGIQMDGMVVSSTVIRRLIQDGDLEEANKLLGRLYEISGTVVPGRQRGGRLLGFPTANIRMNDQVPPKPGVYVVEVELDGMTYGGAANLGYNPTFGGTDLSLEVHILDFSQDIYGTAITIKFIARLRDERRFSGPEALIEQIHQDVAAARELLARWAAASAPASS